jgi:hypothetical protein
VEHDASDYRMMSSMCLTIANTMSLESDRLRLTGRAQQWIELAHQAEAKRLPQNTQGQYTGSVYEAVPPKQHNTPAQENRNIADGSTDEVVLDRAPAWQDYHPEVIDDERGDGSRNIASVSALEASVPETLVTQPGELNAEVQCEGLATRGVESPTQSNPIAEENRNIADGHVVDEVSTDRPFATQDSQTQADPIPNELLAIADGPALDVAAGEVTASLGGQVSPGPGEFAAAHKPD